jgi:hypothetical protein
VFVYLSDGLVELGHGERLGRPTQQELGVLMVVAQIRQPAEHHVLRA